MPFYGFPFQIKFNKKHDTGNAQTIDYVVDNRLYHHSFNVPIYNVILRIFIIIFFFFNKQVYLGLLKERDKSFTHPGTKPYREFKKPMH